MIVFDLRCLESGDRFEAWFRSSADYEQQSERGLVRCPDCGSARVEKAPMAPRLAGREDRSAGPGEALARLAAIQKTLLQGSQWVGDLFPAKARAMHQGEEDPRPIHGRASARDVQAMAEEGVPLVPLPLPVVPPEQLN